MTNSEGRHFSSDCITTVLSHYNNTIDEMHELSDRHNYVTPDSSSRKALTIQRSYVIINFIDKA